jgi:hypothetical protein
VSAETTVRDDVDGTVADAITWCDVDWCVTAADSVTVGDVDCNGADVGNDIVDSTDAGDGSDAVVPGLTSGDGTVGADSRLMTYTVEAYGDETLVHASHKRSSGIGT